MNKLSDAIIQRVIMFFGGIYLALLSLVSPFHGMRFVLNTIERLENRRKINNE